MRTCVNAYGPPTPSYDTHPPLLIHFGNDGRRALRQVDAHTSQRLGISTSNTTGIRHLPLVTPRYPHTHATLSKFSSTNHVVRNELCSKGIRWLLTIPITSQRRVK